MARLLSGELMNMAKIREKLAYDPETGQFTWLVSAGSVKAGDEASSTTTAGYGRVKIEGVYYYLHRLAWAFVHGDFPDSDLDHENLVKSDNRISNLRLATKAENQMNRGVPKNNASGCKGVTWNASRGKWSVRCAANGKRRHLGYFDDVAIATSVYRQHAPSIHGDFYKEV